MHWGGVRDKSTALVFFRSNDEKGKLALRKKLRLFLSLQILITSPTFAQGANNGQTARSSVGQVGQRQTREQVENEPLGRIANRVQSRVQSRISNRIDRYYNPEANRVSPFQVAGDQARTAGKQN